MDAIGSPSAATPANGGAYALSRAGGKGGARPVPHFSLAALAFCADRETLWGTKSQVEDAIPIAKIASIRQNGYRLQMTFAAPVNTAVIRLVVGDERNGRTGSMEIPFPLPSE